MNDKSTKPSRPESMINIEEHIEKVLNVELPSSDNLGRIYDILNFYFDPKLIGVDRIDRDRPSLYVGNHGTLGFEGGLIPKVVLKETGMLPRLLSDDMLMDSPIADNFIKMGQVLAHRDVCRALMQAGHSIMVFPGGAIEAATKRNQRNKLVWGDRAGFVRMAMECGFTITPFAHIGPDDMWDFRVDGDELAKSPLGRALKRVLDDKFDPTIIPPIPKGIAGSLLPRPERLYINFGEPLQIAPSESIDKNDSAEVLAIQQQIAKRIDTLMEEALLERKADRRNMHWFRRRLTRH
mgnify:CR=1 FL=1